MTLFVTACNQKGSGATLQDTDECTECKCTGDNSYSCSSCGTVATTTRNPDWPSDFPDSEFKPRFVFLLSSCTKIYLTMSRWPCLLQPAISMGPALPFRTQTSVKIVCVPGQTHTSALTAFQKRKSVREMGTGRRTSLKVSTITRVKVVIEFYGTATKHAPSYLHLTDIVITSLCSKPSTYEE